MKVVLWLSRHDPTQSQVAELRRLFGAETRVDQDPRPFDNAQEISRRYREGSYADLVAVAPLSVLGKLCELGIKPLWAEMQQLPSSDGAEVQAAGRYYRFLRFRRIKRLVLEFEEV